VHKDLRRAAQAGGREVLRVEVIAPSPLLAGGLSRENDRVRDQQKLAGQGSAELVKARFRLLSQLRSRPTTLNGAVRSAEALVAQYSYTPDASPQR